MAINKTIEATGELRAKFIDMMNSAGDDKLMIVARSELNRKADDIKPIAVKHDIYFYVAKQLDGALAFLNNVTPDMIYTAKANTVRNARLGDMFEILGVMGTAKTLEEIDGLDEPMTIVTSKSGLNGAGVLYCEEFLSQLKAKVGGFYIQPSSVHEIIIVPEDSGISIDDLSMMVREVNKHEVSDDEYLANRAFSVDEWL